jgi:DNA-binding MarR family transcriptional regulator
MRTIVPTPPADSASGDRAAIAATIIAQFRDALRELKCMGGDRMRRTGLSFANSHILGMLDRHGDMPMSRLAELLDVSLSNASGVVDRLEERGLVERVRVADDRRVVLVRVTEAGRSGLAATDVLHDELMQSILARLDERRLRRLAAALVDVREAAAAAIAADPELSRHEHVHHYQSPRPTVPASPA